MVPIGVGGYNISVLPVRESACQLAADSIGFFRRDFARYKGLPQMMQVEDVDEALKARDQMEWVRRMNSIQNRAEEILLNELVYA